MQDLSNAAHGSTTSSEVQSKQSRSVTIECEELNDKVLLCWSEKKDWRQCRTEVFEFKKCFEAAKAKQKNSLE